MDIVRTEDIEKEASYITGKVGHYKMKKIGQPQV